MKGNDTMSFTYKNQTQIEWENNPRYHVLKYRHAEEIEGQEYFQEIAVQEFVDFLKEQAKSFDDEKQSKKMLKQYEAIEKLIPEFFQNYRGWEINKVKQGELEMLQAWKDAVKSE